ncbi:MAG TPA: hypothetical protein VMB47_06975 [Candidatus Aquilonibacter sp.]|nr:hypothetical protein [Candidatus Baltobacteraceae bacterium]HTZ73645.1 hypothetical protein [Candidatus Aquilonibacter sp.]
MNDPSITAFGVKDPGAPPELGVFAFLIGKWEGKGKTKIEDGKFAEYSVTWIGRYILDGTAIADELHGPAPDGSPYLGISLRQYDAARKTWIIEYLNVSNSFLRRQVNSESGSVHVRGRNVTVTSESPSVAVREHYQVEDDGFVYRLDVSSDGGKSWKEGEVEMTLQREKVVNRDS